MATKTSIKLDSRPSAVSSSGGGMRGENTFLRDQYDKAQGQNGKG